ncbi:MAG TPA: flagellar hook-basal body complex protein [Terriglobia bacterium]|nr:flagellar hook-basal body complex protein [Terriglobia bacterium]
MGSFSTSLSGVETAAQNLSVIANDLANLNTTAFKNQEANFQDFFYQMLGTDGAGNPNQIGAGSVMASIISAFTQGTINSTGVPTDMAIQGDGFFVVQNGGSTLYTRAGDFSQNASGYLMDSQGDFVLGYPAVNGVVSPSQTLAPLQISSGQISTPNATTDVELTMNLDASGAPQAAATGTLTATGNAVAGDTITIGGTTYTFVSTLTSTPNEVLISSASTGAEAATLANLVQAINNGPSGTGAGTDYSDGTNANGQVTAAAGPGAGQVTLTATSAGTAGNSIGTTVSLGGSSTFGASFSGATLTGGVDGATFSEPVVVYDSLGNSHTLTFNFTKTAAATPASGTLTATGNATDGDMVTIGGTEYTFVTSLSTDPTVPNQVLISSAATGAEAATLANLAAAINGGSGEGTDYSDGTVANASVTATSGSTTLSLSANSAGPASDSIATTVSLGGSSTFGASFGGATLEGGTDNTWSYRITIPAADVIGASAPVVLTNGSGTLTFNSSGVLTSPAANVADVNVANLADGAKALALTWQLFNPTTDTAEVTQVAGQSNVSSTTQNGYTSGALQSFTINSDGTIQGVFSNGQTLTLGQVALATFQNTQGLQLNGANTFVATPSAGIPSIGAPNSGGRGTIIGQSLEASNVDMTTELSDLIVAERDYQSNARAISTADQMINYVLTMQP